MPRCASETTCQTVCKKLRGLWTRRSHEPVRPSLYTRSEFPSTPGQHSKSSQRTSCILDALYTTSTIFSTTPIKESSVMADNQVIEPNEVNDDLRDYRLYYHPRNPNNCPCGHYSYTSNTCNHVFRKVPYVCGATMATAGSEAAVFCARPAPHIVVDTPRINAPCGKARCWASNN